MLAALGTWCLSQGIALDVEKVLHPDTVERYCQLGLTRTTEQSSATVTSVLRRLGHVLTVRAPWWPQPPVHRCLELPAPYSVKELAIIDRDIPVHAMAGYNHRVMQNWFSDPRPEVLAFIENRK